MKKMIFTVALMLAMVSAAHANNGDDVRRYGNEQTMNTALEMIFVQM